MRRSCAALWLAASLVIASGSVLAADEASPTVAPAVAAVDTPRAAPPLLSARVIPAPVQPAIAAPDSTGSLLRTVSGLAAVLALLALCLWGMKRLGGSRLSAGSVVKVVGGVSVGNRERVMVLEVAGEWIVIGVAPGHVSTLAQMPRQVQPAPAQLDAPGFSAWLKQSIEKRHAK